MNASLRRGLVLVCAVLIAAGAGSGQAGGPAVASSMVPAAVTPRAYLPLVIRNHPSSTHFGMEVGNVTYDLQLVADAHGRWVRQASVEWKDVETSMGARNWPALSWLEPGLIEASTRGMNVILIVRGTPAWAQLHSGVPCGPMKSQNIDEFAAFMNDLVERYSVAPYNVKYWEIWNEPDVDPSQVSADSLFGCWGDFGDTAGFGGGYYAQMLQAVYPQIKAADPQAQVLLGGLLMDCDPPCVQAEFLDGVLSYNGNTGGQYFDGVSFHAYDYGSTTTTGRYVNPNWSAASDTTGPVIAAKVQFIQSELAAHSVNGKYLINTEAAVLCVPESNVVCQNDAAPFSTTKAYYVAEAYAMALKLGLRANLWYSLPGWPGRASRLVDGSATPVPAYYAYQFAATRLAGATYLADVTVSSNIWGYKFRTDYGEVWVVWDKDGTPQNVTFNPAPKAAFDVDGDAMTPSGSMNIGPEPLYLVW
jgi:hypothetical protein